MKRALCLQHVPFEGPGRFAAALLEAGWVVERRLVPVDGLPTDDCDLLLVMGGPMSVNDTDHWIGQETRYVREHVEAGRAYLGICLGSQFLAQAMGGRVYPGPRQELGVTTVRRTQEAEADRLFSLWPPSRSVIEWHGEGLELPPQAVRLAESDDYPTQAFRVGARAYGLLFHVEMDEPALQALCRNCESDLLRAGRTEREVLAEARAVLPALQAEASRLIRQLAEAAT